VGDAGLGQGVALGLAVDLQEALDHEVLEHGLERAVDPVEEDGELHAAVGGLEVELLQDVDPGVGELLLVADRHGCLRCGATGRR
jgi:hypothetical protein